MFKKASDHLKGMATGFVNNAITGGVNNFKSGFVNKISGNQAKVAAAVLKKSPLEIDDSPSEKLSKDPLQFSYIQYPLDLTSNETGHYILFRAISNEYDNVTGDLSVANKLGNNLNLPGTADDGFGPNINSFRQLKNLSGETIKPLKASNTVLSAFPTHSRTTAAIAMYMPPGVSVNYKMAYDASPTDMSGQVAKAISAGKSADTTTQSIEAIVSGVTAGLATAGKKIVDDIGQGLSAGEPSKLIGKAFGVAMNPHEEQFFEKPDFRSFSYSFEFWPRNKEEADAVEKIIFLFKYHMHPTKEGGSGGRLFKVPSEFEIDYCYLSGNNSRMNRIARVVLEDMSVTYGPEEQFSTFESDERGAMPVTHKLELSFRETTYITKDLIYEGY
jgi:hypothetical protein